MKVLYMKRDLWLIILNFFYNLINRKHVIIINEFIESFTKHLLSSDISDVAVNDITNQTKHFFQVSTSEINDKRINYNLLLDILYIISKSLISKYTGDSKDIVSDINDSIRKNVILVCGSVGSGKTSYCGRLASILATKNSGKKILLSSADDKRISGTSHLRNFIKNQDVHYISIDSYQNKEEYITDLLNNIEKHDIAIIDTPGISDIKSYNYISDLLKNINTTDVLCVFDASSGTGGLTNFKKISQFIQFKKIVVSKLDGAFHYGFIPSIKFELNKQCVSISSGEGIRDIKSFDAKVICNNIMMSSIFDQIQSFALSVKFAESSNEIKGYIIYIMSKFDQHVKNNKIYFNIYEQCVIRRIYQYINILTHYSGEDIDKLQDNQNYANNLDNDEIISITKMFQFIYQIHLLQDEYI